MRGWLTGGAVAVGAIVVIALAGGFTTVPDASGRSVPAGELISTGRYDLRVDEVEAVENRLRVHAEVTNRTEKSVGSLPYNVVTVALPDGRVLTTGQHNGIDGWRSGLDPDVPAGATIDFDLAKAAPPSRVRVLVRGLEPSSGFLSGPGELTPGRVLAVVELAVR